MVTEDQKGPEVSTVSDIDDQEMTKYGIIRVPVDHFHFGDFRYTNLKDAIAQAKHKKL